MRLARTVLAHSPDLAQAVLAGFKSLDSAYTEARKAKQSLDAQVVGNVRRKVARSKKVAVLPEIELAKLPAAEQRSLPDAAKIAERVSAITAYSARDPEEPKTTDGSEEIELGKVIARLRRDQPCNADTMRICDALEHRLRRA